VVKDISEGLAGLWA